MECEILLSNCMRRYVYIIVNNNDRIQQQHVSIIYFLYFSNISFLHKCDSYKTGA